MSEAVRSMCSRSAGTSVIRSHRMSGAIVMPLITTVSVTTSTVRMSTIVGWSRQSIHSSDGCPPSPHIFSS